MMPETLEDRLNRTYYEKTVPTELKKDVLSFLEQNASVATRNVQFVKALTKALSKMVAEEPGCLNGKSGTVIKYNLEGAAIAERLSEENISPRQYKNLLTMQSHFNCHAGFVAKMMSGIERNPEDKLALLVDSYEHYMTASEVILPVDLEESAIFLTDASNVARIGYNIACENHDEEHMNYFLRKREAAIEKAIEYSEGYDKVHAKAHLEAALSASLIFSVSNDTESAEKLAKYCREFLRHYEANPHVIGIDIKTILRIKARLHLARAFLKAEEVRNMLRTWNTDSSQPL